MEIPKRINKLLNKRTKSINKYLDYDNELCNWLEKKGIDVMAVEIKDCVRGGAISLCEPFASEAIIKEYLKSL